MTCETCANARDMWPHYKVGCTGCKHCISRLIGFVLEQNLGRDEKQKRAREYLASWNRIEQDPEVRQRGENEIRELVKRRDCFEKVDQTAKQGTSETADKAVSKPRSRTARRR